jgi:hypothetical protein
MKHWILAGIVLAAASVWSPGAMADTATLTLHDVSWIDNGEGAARALFRTSNVPNPRRIVIRQALLRLPLPGPPVERTFELQVHPVTKTWNPETVDWTSDWSRPGGDFDDELFARGSVDLNSGNPVLILDVTAILKELVEERMEADGLILTVPPHQGIGIPNADRARVQGITTATLEVKYRRVSRRPREARG